MATAIAIAGSSAAGEIEVTDGVTLGSVAGLAAPSIAPDGRSIYVGYPGIPTNVLGILALDPQSGLVSFDDFVQADKLFGPSLVSPDGRFVYVGGGGSPATADGAITVYARDPGSGALTFVERLDQGVGGVDGIPNPRTMTLSPDGAHLYVGNIADELGVFSRDPSTGLLDFASKIEDGVAGVSGLATASAIALTADGLFLYVTSQTQDSIAGFARNPSTGALSFIEIETDGAAGVSGIEGPRAVAIASDGPWIWVASNDGIALFSRNLVTGTLALADAQVGAATSTTSIQLAPRGARVYTTQPSEGTIRTWQRDPATGQLALLESAPTGLGPSQGRLTPDRRHLIVTDSASIRVHGTAVVDHAATVAHGGIAKNGLDRPLDVAWSPDGRFAYVASEQSSALVVLEIDRSSGTLSNLDAVFDGDAGVDGLLGAVEVELSPDGDHVYVASQFDDAIAVFSRDAQTGLVSFVQVLEDGVGGVDGLEEASGLLVSPDGDHVYATSFAESSVSLFSRDPVTGLLAFVSRIQDGVGGVDGLGGAVDVASSPAGDHVYVTGFLDQAIAIFSRNPTTGALGFIDSVANGSGGVTGLEQAIDLVISPDGGFAYAAGQAGSIATFVRNPLNGFLSFLSALEDGVGITIGIGNPRELDLSADGTLLAIADGGGRVTIFGRSTETGLLGLRQLELNGVDLPVGIGVTSAVAFSPVGGPALLATGSDDDAAALFVPEPSLGAGFAGGLTTLLLLRSIRAGRRRGGRPRRPTAAARSPLVRHRGRLQ